MKKAAPVSQSQKDKAADLRLRREYQTSLEEYEKVFKFQNERCAICKLPVEPGKPRLAVDHRHSDGLLRGLLCWKCNRAIGAFQRFHPDTIELFRAAYEYLIEPPFKTVFGTERFTAPGRVGTKKRAKLLKEMQSPKQEINGFRKGQRQATPKLRRRKKRIRRRVR